jgi:hypothetical protein
MQSKGSEAAISKQLESQSTCTTVGTWSQQVTNHESSCATWPYDQRHDQMLLDEVQSRSDGGISFIA